MNNAKKHNQLLFQTFLKNGMFGKILFFLTVLIFLFSCKQTTKEQAETAIEKCFIQSKYEVEKAIITDFLIRHVAFRDVNPIHQEYADELNAFVRKVFEKQYTSDEIPDLITQALGLLYDNSIGVFEDSPDVRRMTIRRSMCFMALAFLADEWRYPTFLADARNTLNNIEGFANSEMLLIVNMIELYRTLNSGYASKRAIAHTVSRLQGDLKNIEKAYIDKYFIAEYNKILAEIANLQ